MLWFFARNHQELALETRYDNETSEYVLIVHTPKPTRETFKDLESFRTRLIEVEHQLKADDWSPSGVPIVLADGWPDERPTQ